MRWLTVTTTALPSCFQETLRVDVCITSMKLSFHRESYSWAWLSTSGCQKPTWGPEAMTSRPDAFHSLTVPLTLLKVSSPLRE